MLAWLLEESTADEVRAQLRAARSVLASDLTVVECRRALIRLRAHEELSEAKSEELAAVLERSAAHWTLLALDREVTSRAGSPLPGEPLRTLDALHLASAVTVRNSVANLAFLSLDERLRRAAESAGFEVLP